MEELFSYSESIDEDRRHAMKLCSLIANKRELITIYP